MKTYIVHNVDTDQYEVLTVFADLVLGSTIEWCGGRWQVVGGGLEEIQ